MRHKQTKEVTPRIDAQLAKPSALGAPSELGLTCDAKRRRRCLFTVHPYPAIPLESPKLVKLVIKETVRREVKKLLYKYGISRKTLFPGLDGLAADLDWLHSDAY